MLELLLNCLQRLLRVAGKGTKGIKKRRCALDSASYSDQTFFTFVVEAPLTIVIMDCKEKKKR
jgi:hypothetical protein